MVSASSAGFSVERDSASHKTMVKLSLNPKSDENAMRFLLKSNLLTRNNKKNCLGEFKEEIKHEITHASKLVKKL